ncbi:MAG: arabinan endo-1,5-alpha-L-arabinosidase [Roseiflexaceae bacterium]
MQTRSVLRPRIILLLLLALLPAACARAAKAPTVLQGDFRVHDPSIIKQNDTFYVFSTGDERGLNHGTIQIRRSLDLTTWELLGTIFPTMPDWIAAAIGGAPPNLWAPDISFFNGKYHLYYAGSRFGTNNSVIGLATNSTLDPASPEYQWIDEGLIVRSRLTDNWNAIDPNIGLDADNMPWLSFGSFWDGIKMRRIDPSTGKLASDDTTLYSLASRQGGPIEAPSIVYRDGYYYLFVSFDLCCRSVISTYNIRVGRSATITGPYIDRDGKGMDRGGGTLLLETKDRFVGPGGQMIYLDDRVYRMVNHYYDRSDQGTPKLQIHDLEWTSDGWPQLATP